MEKKLPIPPNGANVIVPDEGGRILFVRANYGAKQWMLPGGKVERSETSLDAAVSELAEETDLIVRPQDMRFLGVFFQSAGSNVCLFECERYQGTLTREINDEIRERQFMSIDAIISLYPGGDVGRAYAVMAVAYDNIRRGLMKPPLVLRMFDPIAFAPKAII